MTAPAPTLTLEHCEIMLRLLYAAPFPDLRLIASIEDRRRQLIRCQCIGCRSINIHTGQRVGCFLAPLGGK